MDRDILRPGYRLSEEIPIVVSHSPKLIVDYLCMPLCVDMLLLS